MASGIPKRRRKRSIGAFGGVGELPSSLRGVAARSAAGETLTAAKVDSVNSFDAPRTVAPKPFSATVQGGTLALQLEPKSVTVLSIEPGREVPGSPRKRRLRAPHSRRTTGARR